MLDEDFSYNDLRESYRLIMDKCKKLNDILAEINQFKRYCHWMNDYIQNVNPKMAKIIGLKLSREYDELHDLAHSFIIILEDDWDALGDDVKSMARKVSTYNENIGCSINELNDNISKYVNVRAV